MKKNEAGPPLIKDAFFRVFIFYKLSYAIGVILYSLGGYDNRFIYEIVRFFSLQYDGSTLLCQFIDRALYLFCVVLLPVAFCRRVFDRKSIRSLGFSFKPKDFFIGLGLGALFFCVAFGLLYLMGSIEIVGYFEIKVIHLLLYFFLYVVVALDEEIFFRGYVLNNLLAARNGSIVINKFMALTITSLLFAVAHQHNPDMSLLSYINLTLAGYVFGIYYLYHKNLWFSIGMHLIGIFFKGLSLGFVLAGFTRKD